MFHTACCEFSHVVTVVVDVSPSEVVVSACDVIHSTVVELQTKHPRAFIVTNGESNHVSISKTLTNITQYVDCKTRKNKALDLLYANRKEVNSSLVLPPLGRSEHSLIHFLPTYKPVLSQQPVTTRTVKERSKHAEEALHDCFQSTNWNLFLGEYREDIEGITDYMQSCEDNVVSTSMPHWNCCRGQCRRRHSPPQ